MFSQAKQSGMKQKGISKLENKCFYEYRRIFLRFGRMCQINRKVIFDECHEFEIVSKVYKSGEYMEQDLYISVFIM